MLKNIKNFLVISKIFVIRALIAFSKVRARMLLYIYCRTYFDLLFYCGLCSFFMFFPFGYMEKLK